MHATWGKSQHHSYPGVNPASYNNNKIPTGTAVLQIFDLLSDSILTPVHEIELIPDTVNWDKTSLLARS